VHEAAREAEIGDAAALRERERQGLEVVVAQHEAADLVGHLGEQRVARLLVKAAVALRGGERDLDVHLHVGGVDAGRVVDGVRVEANAARAASMRPRWVAPRLAPSPITLARTPRR
jgi:hypothetical protein